MATMVVTYDQFKRTLIGLVGVTVFYAMRQPGFVALASLATGDTLAYQDEAAPETWAQDFPASIKVESIQF